MYMGACVRCVYVQVHVYMCAHVYRGKRAILGIILSHSLHWTLSPHLVALFRKVVKPLDSVVLRVGVPGRWSLSLCNPLPPPSCCSLLSD